MRAAIHLSFSKGLSSALATFLSVNVITVYETAECHSAEEWRGLGDA